jgi:prepilin-type N-terminal cleavage/methylation domain-containing protein
MSLVHKAQNTQGRGFSIIELVVVMAIFLVITSLVLINNNRFQGDIVLSNLAYDIALSIRQAQTYGLSVRGVGTTFTAPYGVHILGSVPTEYTFFVDAANPYQFEDAPGEKIESFQLNHGFIIYDFCAVAAGASNCSTSIPGGALNILFERPDPDAIITDGTGSRVNGVGVPYDEAQIYVQSPQGALRVIKVFSTGQISVQ